MSEKRYDPNSSDAAISRIEAKLDMALERLNNHGRGIDELWKALGKIDVRVACIAGGVSVVAFVAKMFFAH